jgi:hypothetical protein
MVGNGGRVTVSSDTARSGTSSLKFNYPATPLGTDTTAEQRFTLGSPRTNVYIRYYIKFPSNYKIRSDSPSNNKFIEIWGEEGNYSTDRGLMGTEAWDTPSGLAQLGPTAYMQYNPNRLSYAPGAFYTHIWWSGILNSWTLQASDLNKWLCFEWHFKSDSGAGDGALELFVNGIRVYGSTSLKYDAAPVGNYFKTGYLMGWSNSGFNENTDIYIDDVVMSNSYIGPDNTASAPQAPNFLRIVSY